MARKKATEVERSEIEAALLETAEKTAAQPTGVEAVLARPWAEGMTDPLKAKYQRGCRTCGSAVTLGEACPVDGRVAELGPE